MQKISKINQILYFLIILLEILILNYYLVTILGVTIGNNTYCFLRVNIVNITFDIAYWFYLLDQSIEKKRPKNILNQYRYDCNHKLISRYFIMIFLKVVVFFLAIGDRIWWEKESYQKLILYYSFLLLIFYSLVFFFPKQENKYRKLKRLKRELKKEKIELEIILLEDGLPLPSSLSFEPTEYEISSNHLYLYQKERLEIEKYYHKKDFLLKNALVLVFSYQKEEEIQKKLQAYKQDHLMYYIMLQEENKIKEKKLEYMDSLLLGKIEDGIPFIESVIATEKSSKIARFTYWNQFNLYKETKDSIHLNLACKQLFLSRMKRNRKVKINTYLFGILEENAYVSNSPYQSILIFLNSITVMSKFVLYYLYQKRTKQKELVYSLVGDSISIFQENIKKYVEKTDIIYHNIKEKKIPFNSFETILIKDYFASFLGVKLEGEQLSFFGIMELLRKIRNKVEAHGSISDDNVYIIWCLEEILVKKLKEMLEIEKFHYMVEEEKVYAWYEGDKKKYGLGEYVVEIDGMICFLHPPYKTRYQKEEDKKYINYLTGNQSLVPSIVYKEGKE